MNGDYVVVDGLLNQTRAYVQRPRVKADVEHLASNIRSLIPSLGQYVYEDGRAALLIHLNGTVPIFYKGAQYNIPVAIWVPEAYPHVAPRCYVKPTPDMRIKERHKHVDDKGFVYLPYLHSWTPASNLLEMVHFMSSAFSEDPPVFSDPHRGGVRPSVNPVEKKMPERKSPPSPVNPAALKKDKLVKDVTTRLQDVLKKFYQETTAEIDGLFEKQKQLSANSTKVNDGLAALRKEKELLRRSEELLAAKSSELEAWLATNEKTDKIDVDTAVTPSDVWSRQMLEAVAEDRGIDDTMYQIDKALQDNRIDLQSYLKLIRRLARDQFYQRALSLRVHERQLHRNSQRMQQYI